MIELSALPDKIVAGDQIMGKISDDRQQAGAKKLKNNICGLITHHKSQSSEGDVHYSMPVIY
jgi:hypothetical protein